MLFSFKASRIAQDLSGDVYLLPTLPVGCSGLHLGQNGTIALDWTTMVKVVSDLIESFLAQDITKVAVLVGLGGANETTVRPRENYIVKTAVRQLNYDHRDLDAIWVQPFTVAGGDLRNILDSADVDVHAGELATSLMMYLEPDSVKGASIDYVPEVGKEYLDFVAFNKLCPGGVWGRPSLATAEKGRRSMEAAVKHTVVYIEESFAHLATMKKRVYT